MGVRSTQPSLPPSEPAHSRHLGSGSRGDRAVRAQLVIALIALLVMVAVPLYLLRRPRVETRDPKAAGSADAKAGSPTGLSPLAPGTAPVPPTATSAQPRGLNVGDAKIIRCQKGNTKVPPEQCDRQPFFEEALVKAIRDNASCVSSAPSGGTVNFVLDIDYKRKKSHAWAGKSGSLKKKSAKEAVSCVNKALPPPPDWAQVPHQHERYQIAVLATYPPSSGSGAGDTGQ